MIEDFSILHAMTMARGGKPEAIGLTLDENGWAEVNELIQFANLRGSA